MPAGAAAGCEDGQLWAAPALGRGVCGGGPDTVGRCKSCILVALMQEGRA